MIMHFRDLDPHALLVQECDNDFCGRTTLHGFPGRLKWIWAIPSVSVRPVCGCDGCGEQWRVEFAVDESPTRGQIAAAEDALAGLVRTAERVRS